MNALTILRVAGVVLVASGLTACGPRTAGPNEGEYGQIFYWQVTDSGLEVGEDCTDADDWQDTLEPVPFSENTYLIYKVAPDGSEAVSQSCATTDATSCADSDSGIVFQIDGSTLTYDPEAELYVVDNSACDLEGDAVWTMSDDGETLHLDVDIDYSLVGDATACEALEEQIQLDSPNGKGIDACTVTLTVDATFDSAQSP